MIWNPCGLCKNHIALTRIIWCMIIWYIIWPLFVQLPIPCSFSRSYKYFWFHNFIHFKPFFQTFYSFISKTNVYVCCSLQRILTFECFKSLRFKIVRYSFETQILEHSLQHFEILPTIVSSILLTIKICQLFWNIKNY